MSLSIYQIRNQTMSFLLFPFFCFLLSVSYPLTVNQTICFVKLSPLSLFLYLSISSSFSCFPPFSFFLFYFFLSLSLFSFSLSLSLFLFSLSFFLFVIFLFFFLLCLLLGLPFFRSLSLIKNCFGKMSIPNVSSFLALTFFFFFLSVFFTSRVQQK